MVHVAVRDSFGSERGELDDSDVGDGAYFWNMVLALALALAWCGCGTNQSYDMELGCRTAKEEEARIGRIGASGGW